MPPTIRSKTLAKKKKPFNFAHVDTDRLKRCGCAEVIFGLGKTPDQILKIALVLKLAHQSVLVTRTTKEVWICLKKHLQGCQFDPASGLLSWINPLDRSKKSHLRIIVCAAGTSDLPIAEEAALTSEFFGNDVERIYDVGVAGIQRLLNHLDQFQTCDALIAVAGMEGALPSVLAGLVSCPVVAVPTSIGYGANLQGVTALLGMLTSCASGLSVVNIDNGFGAAMAIERMKHLRK